MKAYSLGKNTLRNLETLYNSGEPRSAGLVEAVKGFIEITPADFCIIENGGYRTAEMQNGIYLKKHSKCDGYNKKSKHQLGLAVDLVPWIDGKPQWNRDSALWIAGAFIVHCRQLGLNITSGSDWNGDGLLKGDSWDPCHFQIN